MQNVTSKELVSKMKIGWNLGNTLDSYDKSKGELPKDHETAWNNPVTTKAMIDTIASAGFNILRVPTTWCTHMGPEPEYKISPEWMARVEEIVNYGISNNMFVILNLHHEDWHFPAYHNLHDAKEILIKLWTQIAEHFKKYDEHLIFECMNEPRMVNTPLEWAGGNEEARDVINQLNEQFVTIIRSTGGNNILRHLMIPSHAASSSYPSLEGFKVPNDDKVMVSIHAYVPYNFALNKEGVNTFSSQNESDAKEITLVMDTIKANFTDRGYQVILGETGTMNKDNLSARIDWAEYFIKTAKTYGIPCIWWDNGLFESDGENFGLLDRHEISFRYPEIIEALQQGLK